MMAPVESSLRFTIRPAETEDIPELEPLIARSARRLGDGFYTIEETEAAIAHVFGVDSELITDRSYLIARDPDGKAIGCGGWSRRATLFGGDRFAGRAAGLLDPAQDAARIRAFFVDPDCKRSGVGSALLAACCDAARAAGFRRLTLMATLPGVPFYRHHGFVAETATVFELGGVAVQFVPMVRDL